jgi:hypothetical protein
MPSYLIQVHFIAQVILTKNKTVKIFMVFSADIYLSLHLRPKYILHCLFSINVSQCYSLDVKRQSFTNLPTYRQHYISLYFKFYIFRYLMGR